MSKSSSPNPVFADALERIRAERDRVEAAMRAQLACDSDLIRTIGEHLLSSGGKRIRPALVIWTARLHGYSGPRQIQVAAALEFIHAATLLHDDVVDGSELRRGHAAAHALWGNRRAILVGDYFYACASRLIVEDGDFGVLRVFSDTIGGMAQGELIQLQQSFQPEISEAQYYQVIQHKTATLLSAACEIGAIVSGVGKAAIQISAEYGQQLGLAFQIRDDALDYVAGEEVLGKPRFTDLHEGKVTLPLIFALERATPAEREKITTVLKTASANAMNELVNPDALVAKEAIDFSAVLEILEVHRCIADADARAYEHAQKAKQILENFSDGESKRALLAAADFSVQRGY